MAVIVTEKAANEIKRVLTDQAKSDGTVLRIGVKAGGCSGFQYNLALDADFDTAKDEISEQHGIKVAVDKKSMLYLDGTEIDYYDGLDKRGFSFENPNVVKSCGCGSSFQA
ncbi:MAG: iron-sulfur cluster assembly accessory protein [Planctomycetaceae bacterium]|nr:iron-sulfur cluster assembly accessory protein [Planctomycetaceae bacterium]